MITWHYVYCYLHIIGATAGHMPPVGIEFLFLFFAFLSSFLPFLDTLHICWHTEWHFLMCDGVTCHLGPSWSCLRRCCFSASSTPVRLLYAFDRACAWARDPFCPSPPRLCLLGGAASSTKCSLAVSATPCSGHRLCSYVLRQHQAQHLQAGWTAQRKSVMPSAVCCDCWLVHAATCGV